MNRPKIHYSVKKNWLNDPNGLVYYNGEYHLFYQYNPNSDKWGPMHWGHAVSKDLIEWKDLPVALYPDKDGMCFSGCAVVDSENKSNFFDKKGLVAIYTTSDFTKNKDKGYQTQSIAYSEDGYKWTKYKGNPVIENPGIIDFRDPKVIRYENNNKWVLLLAVEDRIYFYDSFDLINWKFKSEFGKDKGIKGEEWECPELFKFKVDNKTKWVLKVSFQKDSIGGGSGEQYFVGDFDGVSFVATENSGEHEIVDYGRDFYASQSWENTEERKILLGWMNNSQYAQDIPSSGWRGMMSIPRKLGLKKIEEKYILIQNPVKELLDNCNIQKRKDNIQIKDKKILSTYDKAHLINFKFKKGMEFNITLRNNHNEKIKIIFRKKYIIINRENSGEVRFSDNFCNKYKIKPYNNLKIRDIKLLVDRYSLEIFINQGEIAITDLVFPKKIYNKMEIKNFSKKENLFLKELKIFEL
ncbi:MAG: glycoside hydrolase family 32 protein [Fusobacteriota bacterium]